MKRFSTCIAILFIALSFVGNAQENANITKQTNNLVLIAVVNRANWCSVCIANEKRFEALTKPYVAKGLHIYINDLTNNNTLNASRLELEQLNIYEAVATIQRKGLGKMLKSCGLANNKKTPSLPSGIVTFINPKTHKQIKQFSIASNDEEIKTTIETLLK